MLRPSARTGARRSRLLRCPGRGSSRPARSSFVDERVPGGDRCAPQRRRLLVAQVLGAVDEAVLVQDDLIGEHAVKPAGEHRCRRRRAAARAVEPALEDNSGDRGRQACTRDTAELRLDDLAGSIEDTVRSGSRHRRGAMQCSTSQDVAVVQRDGPTRTRTSSGPRSGSRRSSSSSRSMPNTSASRQALTARARPGTGAPTGRGCTVTGGAIAWPRRPPVCRRRRTGLAAASSASRPPSTEPFVVEGDEPLEAGGVRETADTDEHHLPREGS